MGFSKKLIQLRKANGMSQEDLADKLGVSRQAISRWEQGSTFPDLPNLQKICKVFSVSADYLISDEHTEEREEEAVSANVQENERNDSKIKENRFLIIGCIWIFAALCFEITAFSTLNVVHLGLACIDIVLACVNFFLHFRNKRK